jgi:glycerol-3-phosphate acyltransferase PlsY
MKLSLLILSSYLIGAIPFSFILAKLNNVDLRKIGSGNIGATNLARALGYKIGAIGLVLDVLKGVIPVVYLADIYSSNLIISKESFRLFLGIVSICGHNWTVFLKFKGGKGIATSLGALIGLSIKNLLIAKVVLILTFTWFATFLIWGYVSLSSIISAFILPIFLYIFGLDKDLVLFGAVLASFAIFRHKSNIIRILQKKEHRFDIKSKFLSRNKKALS